MHKIYIKHLNYKCKVSAICYKYIVNKWKYSKQVKLPPPVGMLVH